MSKRVVGVFGGSGFVGSHVADALTEAGYEVVIFDCKESPYLLPGQKMIIGDILDKKAVEDLVKDCNIVYNFVGIADIGEADQNPIETVKINILGTTYVLDACYNAKIERFIFASSLYVYSNTGSFYRVTKQSCELLIENYGKAGLPYTIIRYGSLYGPRADYRNPIYKILKQALVEGKITRIGDGEEVREYIHVRDAAKASVEILFDEYLNQHVIFTGHQQIKVKDLLLMIKEILSSKMDVKLEFLSSAPTHNYNITPYSFTSKVGRRFVGKYYLDLGQGILDCMYKIHEELNL